MLSQPMHVPASEMLATVPEARSRRFLGSCGGSYEDALTLYFLDLRLSALFHEILRLIEVSLREAIHTNLTTRFGARWFDELGHFDQKFQKEQRDVYEKLARKRGVLGKLDKSLITPDDVVSNMSIGTWRNLLSDGTYREGVRVNYEKTLWEGPEGLAHCFTDTDGQMPKFGFVKSLVARTADSRNRVSHCEPIVFGFPQSRANKGDGRAQRRTVAALVFDMRILYSMLHPENRKWIFEQEEINLLLADDLLEKAEQHIISIKLFQLVGIDKSKEARSLIRHT